MKNDIENIEPIIVSNCYTRFFSFLIAATYQMLAELWYESSCGQLL